MPETFRLIFDGQIADGKTEDEVKAALSSKLKISEQIISKIFSSSTIVLKKNMDAKQAQQYQKAFESAGLICRLESEVPPTPATPPGFMECPKCGHQQPVADDCVKCGVVIAKAQVTKKEETVRLKNLSTSKPLQETLMKYKELLDLNRAFFAPDIPIKKIQAAQSKYAPCSSGETPLFLYDNSAFKDNGVGLVITDKCVYGRATLSEPFSYTWDQIERADYKPGLNDGLTINGKLVSDLATMSQEHRLIIAEMIQDLKGEKRMILPFGQDLWIPQICCGCLSPTSEPEITVHLLSKPPRSTGKKAASFLLSGVFFNLTPVGFLATRGLMNMASTSMAGGFVPSEIKLPCCSKCRPVDVDTGLPVQTMHTWAGKLTEAALAQIKTGFAWFEILFKNQEYAEKLREMNPGAIFSSWIEMSTHKPEEAVEKKDQTQQTVAVSAGTDQPPAAEPVASQDKAPLDGGPIDHVEVFASLVQGMNNFTAQNIPEKKLRNAKKAFAQLGSDEKIVGLHDFTVWGSAKEGVVFTDKSIYWKVGHNKGRIRYNDINPDNIECTTVGGMASVVIGPEKSLPFVTLDPKELRWVEEYLKRVC